VDAILSLAELRQDGLISVDEAVALLQPTTVRVDDIVGILTRVAAQMASEVPSAQPPPVTVLVQQPAAVPPMAKAHVITQPPAVTHPLYLMTAVSDDEAASAQDTIRRLLDNGWYVFGDRTPGRKDLKPGDHICFYEAGVGVVAEAEVDSQAEKKTVPFVRHPERFPWAFKVKNVRYFFEQPVVIDAPLRAKLDKFHGRDPERSWAWFVQATQKVTKHDFDLLTGHLVPVASGG
jgi:hypothetical protein